MRQIRKFTVPIDNKSHKIMLTGFPMKVAVSELYTEVEFWSLEDDSMEAEETVFQVFLTDQGLPENAYLTGTCDRTKYMGIVYHLCELVHTETLLPHVT